MELLLVKLEGAQISMETRRATRPLTFYHHSTTSAWQALVNNMRWNWPTQWYHRSHARM